MIIFLMFIIGIAGFILKALVFSHLWNWFPAEIFGIQTIGMAGSLGLLLVIGFFKNHKTDDEKDYGDKGVQLQIIGKELGLMLAYLILLLGGYIVHFSV